jgi:hypothetical protein
MGNWKEKLHVGNLAIGGRIILKCILGKSEGHELVHLAQERDR